MPETKKSLLPLAEMLLRVDKEHGKDDAWKDLIVGARKCLAGISNSKRAKVWLTEIPGPLAEKWDAEEICLKWAYFARKTPSHVRLQLADKCFFCGRLLNKKERTRDHLWPKSRGGVNTVTACRKCNRDKGAMLPEQFRLILFGDAEIKFFAECQMELSVSIENGMVMYTRVHE